MTSGQAQTCSSTLITSRQLNDAVSFLLHKCVEVYYEKCEGKQPQIQLKVSISSTGTDILHPDHLCLFALQGQTKQ